MKECINCKTQLEDDELFCHECGTKQEEIAEVQENESQESQGKKCIYCGEEIESDSTFCPFCGKPQEDEQEEDSQSSQESEQIEEAPEPEPGTEPKQGPQTESEEQTTYEWQEEESHSNKIRIYAAIILVIAIIGGIGLYLSSGNEENKEETVDTDIIDDGGEPLKYEDFLVLYEALQDKQEGWYKMPSKELIDKYELVVEEWRQPQFSVVKRVIGKNIIQNGDGNPLANGTHAWCFYWETSENDPQLYLYIYDINDYEEFVASAKKFGLIEVLQPAEYDEGYENVVYAIKKRIGGNKRPIVKYNDRTNYEAIGPFEIVDDCSVRLGFGGIEGFVIEEDTVMVDEESEKDLNNDGPSEQSESQQMNTYEKVQNTERSHSQNAQEFAAYFIYGAEKELKGAGILSNNGALLENYNKDYFTKIDTRVDNVINLYSTFAKLITSHPSDSYTLTTNANGKYVLKITNPQSFWRNSKYLVILVK